MEKHGFILQRESKVEEVNGMARIFEHEKSGARLLHLETDDDNKVFSIFFRTPPPDNTGVAHILEHSLLCGSRKFPSKEPFLELLKGSLNTFLNAMTFSDKTGYPVASRNEKDFFNLMDVYLDAVFYPRIYDKKEIFLQEGWHYELNSPEDQLTYNGVVYNEMKGAFSSPEQTLFRKIEHSLFPDTPYGLESGGDPEEIPKLTYEQFIDFHRAYYHPSNSFIYLYGDGDLDSQLAFLNENYLADFSKAAEPRSSISLQKPFSSRKEISESYPVSREESTEEKTYLALSFVTTEVTEIKTIFGLSILIHILLQTPASPLKKALLEAELGKDILSSFESEIRQPIFSVIVKNSDPGKKEPFLQTFRDTLEKLVREGLAEDLITASLNNIEFKLREADFKSFPKGLVYNIQALSSWLYDGDPLTPLRFETWLAEIRRESAQGYFEDLIRRYLLDNSHSSLVTLIPEPGLISRKEKELADRLAAYKAGLSDEEIKEVVENTRRLHEHQQEKDSPEELAAVPLLSLDDIDPEAEKLPLEKRAGTDGLSAETITHPMFTNNIGYVNLYFDISHIPPEDIPWLGLLENVLGRIDTAKRDYMSLAKLINTHLGGLFFTPQGFSRYKDRSFFYPKFTLSSKSLLKETDNMAAIMEEIIQESRFSNKRRIKEIIQEERSHMEMEIMGRGHTFAVRRLSSAITPAGRFQELFAGISYYQFIKDLEENFEQRQEEISARLQEISRRIFGQNKVLVSITAQDDDLAHIEEKIGGMLKKLPEVNDEPVDYSPVSARVNEGFIIPGQVQYVAASCDFQKSGFSYDHRMQILQQIVGTDYLWNNIRVLGGAYGAGARFLHNSTGYFTSFRDPNLEKTLETFAGTPDYIKNFQPDEREMRKYVIGTVSNLDSPLTPSMKGKQAAADYICRLSQEEIQRERDEIIGSSAEDIRSFGPPLATALEETSNYCVIGSEAGISKAEHLFDSISQLL
ncbi:MAG: insulinase family protein [Desulfurivibrionaceae bacterium]